MVSPSWMDVGSLVAQEAVFNVLESFIVIPKTLVQLGYEPLPAIQYTNFLGMRGYLRPNAFKMCGLLFNTHGHEVLLTGFTTRLLERLSYRYTFIRVTRAMEKVLPEQMYSKDAEAKADFTTRVLNTAVTATVSQCAAVVICHPFRLLGVRLIGQLIGGPQIYKPFGWYAVLQTEGVGGLYSGLGVAILAEAVQAVVMSLTAALAYEYVAPLLLGENKTRDGGESEAEQDSEEEAQTMFIRQFVSVQMASSLGNPLFYPFQVARTLMIVNGTELEIARKTPDFTSPMHCLNYLSLQPSHRGLMRGANILRRFTWVE